MPSPLFLLAVILLFLGVRDIWGAVLYRIGAPFTAAEKDSLEGLGLDYVEIDWSVAQLLEAVELDSLHAGSLQPNYFDEGRRHRGGRCWTGRDSWPQPISGSAWGMSPVQ